MKPLTKYWLWAKLIGYVLLPIFLLLAPANLFDHGPPLCFSVIFLGMECLGCGMTRSMMHLIHFEFQEAYYYNALGFVVFPLLAWFWGKWFLKDLKKLRAS